jgi:hypothetical protein
MFEPREAMTEFLQRITMLFKRSKKSMIGGFSITVVGLGGALWIGKTSGYEAQQLLDQTVPNINSLCNTIILASATILALLLTLLGLSSGIKINFKKAFYARIQQVAFFDTVLFVVTMLIFLVLNFPVAQSESLPPVWFEWLYYATLAASAVVGGMIVTVMLLLYDTVTDLIQIVGYHREDHPMLEAFEEDTEGPASRD